MELLALIPIAALPGAPSAEFPRALRHVKGDWMHQGWRVCLEKEWWLWGLAFPNKPEIDISVKTASTQV